VAIAGPLVCETCANGGDPLAALAALDQMPGAPTNAEAALLALQRGEITSAEFLERLGVKGV
jgi:hypothetical protein